MASSNGSTQAPPELPSIDAFFHAHDPVSVGGATVIPKKNLRSLLLSLYKAIPSLGRLSTQNVWLVPRQYEAIEASLAQSRAHRGDDPHASAPGDKQQRSPQGGPKPWSLRVGGVYTKVDVAAWAWDAAALLVDKWIQCHARDDRHGREVSLDAASWQRLARWVVDALPGIDDDARGRLLTTTSTQECVEQVAVLSACGCGVDIDHGLLLQHIAPICIWVLEPTEFLAMTLCRTRLVAELLGETLSKLLRAYVHAEDFKLPQAINMSDIGNDLAQEMVKTRQELTSMRSSVNTSNLIPEVAGSSLVLQAPRKRARREEKLDIQSAWVRFVLNCNLAFANAPKTVAAAEQLMAFDRRGDRDGIYDAMEHCLSRTSIVRHARLLDMALDLHQEERLFKASWQTYA